MFFLNQEVDEKEAKPPKKAPTAKLAANGSPVKNKTAGGKVLRNKTRSAAQEELIQSTAQKISEHQRELHAKLQHEGLEKYSESGGGLAGKEGKTWKKFQAYKGEAGLPREVENLRVSLLLWLPGGTSYMFSMCRSSSTGKHRPSCFLYMDSLFLSILTQSRTLARTMKENSPISALISRPLASWPGRKKILYVCH